jgi:hypothetical protein
MRHRIALIVGSVAASGALAFALAASGLGPADPSPIAAVATVPAAPATPPAPQVDIVYVPAPAKPQTITVHRTVASGGEHENGEHEGGGDD